MSSMDEHTGKMHAHTIDVYAAVKQYSFKNIFSYSSFCPCDETQTKSNLRKRGFLRLTGYSLFLMEPRAETQSGTQKPWRTAACWLTQVRTHLVSYTSQDHLPRELNAVGWDVLCQSRIKAILTDMTQANLVWEIPQTRLPSQVTSAVSS